MRGFFLLIFISLSFKVLYCQNVIPNPSFEQGECPSGHSIKPQDFKVDFWLSADGGTPDYFHLCGKNNAGNHLLNWAGGQNSIDGKAYIGLYLKKGSYQENIGIKFSDPLKEGISYKGQFYIARAANSEYLPSEISIAITTSPIKICLVEEFDHRQIRIALKKPRELDTFSWEKVEFDYTAKGDEQYLYVGSLHNKTKLHYKNPVRHEAEPMLNNAEYVYLDNFFFEEVGSENVAIEVPQFELVRELRPISIYYEFNESIISDAGIERLDSLAKSLSSTFQVLVTGSTDSLGTDYYNKELGLKRALAVKEYLVFHGISEHNIEALTKGEQTPQYPNHSEAYRSMNRSALIEFFIKRKLD